jgi:hypothetical protein
MANKHIEEVLKTLNKEMQIKILMRFYFTLAIINITKN